MGVERDEVADDGSGGTVVTAVATDPRWIRQTDTAGAVLLVVACVGAAAWTWSVLRSLFDLGGGPSILFGVEDSLARRGDVIASQVPILVLAGLVGGLGTALRAFASARSQSSTNGSVVGHPFGRLLAVAAGSLVLLVLLAALSDGGDDDGFDLGAADDEAFGDAWFEDEAAGLDLDDDAGAPVMDRWEELVPAAGAAPQEPTHTLEVHTDGCGVFRSGEIGEDLTWVVKDLDGFQVLGRNAAGETQYRYFRPGTYTVVLESWAGGYYAEVSNEVTINC